jgi:type II secretory pathway pseudopilin PulG
MRSLTPAGSTTSTVVGQAGASPDGGFSLVEAVVSVALFAIVAASSGVALVNAVRYAESNENRVVAAGLATAQIEQARSAPDPAALLPGSSQVVRDGTPFTIERVLAPINGCRDEGSRTITVVVDWPGPGGPVLSDTVRAC